MRVCIFYQGARERRNREREGERERQLFFAKVSTIRFLVGQCVSRKTRIPFALKEERCRDHLYLERERERVSEREKLYTEHRAYKLVTNNRVRTNTCLSRFCFNFFCSSFSPTSLLFTRAFRKSHATMATPAMSNICANFEEVGQVRVSFFFFLSLSLSLSLFLRFNGF